MKSKNPPQANMAGVDIASFSQEQFGVNHTRLTNSFKPSVKKTPPIFTDVLNPRTLHARLLHE